MDNIINIKTDKNELKADLERLKRHLDVVIEYSVLTAKITRASYNALIKEGFSEQEALYLCKSKS